MRRLQRRTLVLTSESARHPFRRTLSPRVFVAALPADVEAAENEQARRAWRLSGADWRGFLSAYCASLVAIAVFIA
ncbi:hypothetical protein [Sphingomonas sp. IC081]|uniref:hypothetical protein n=1 Tax=Sphingomonas sp. IC081 TaxID=304378 RepID=UPI001158AEAB|nr:hypothetical protein [Sphingomonas sp. IC081]QDK32094.1 hypothetical protein DM450_04705 [Sphingomonas sp. IC081]